MSFELTEELDRNITGTVWNFYNKYGGDPADMLQDAYVACIKEAETHDPSKGDFLKRMRYVAYRTLKDKRRSTLRKMYGHKQLVESNLDSLPASARFDLDRILIELSEDAKTIVTILIDSEDNRPGNRKGLNFIQKTLRKLGWSKPRVLMAIAEVGAAL